MHGTVQVVRLVCLVCLVCLVYLVCLSLGCLILGTSGKIDKVRPSLLQPRSVAGLSLAQAASLSSPPFQAQSLTASSLILSPSNQIKSCQIKSCQMKPNGNGGIPWRWALKGDPPPALPPLILTLSTTTVKVNPLELSTTAADTFFSLFP